MPIRRLIRRTLPAASHPYNPLAYLAARGLARLTRRGYAFWGSYLRGDVDAAPLPYEVFSFSGANEFPEQLLSVRSLLRFAGRPATYTIVSDGSHDSEQVAALRDVDSCIDVVDWREFVKQSLPKAVSRYAEQHPLGKKLAVQLSLPDVPLLYSDSDVLFFPGARRLRKLAPPTKAPMLFLVDYKAALDQRLLRGEEASFAPLNSGFYVLTGKLGWEDALGRLEKLEGQPTFFTEQTLVHLAAHWSGAQPLPSTLFLLTDIDRFAFRDRFSHYEAVLRHCVSPVRHKFWTALPKVVRWSRG